MNLIFRVLTYAIIYVLIHQIISRFYLLKLSFIFSSTLVLISSIDVVFVLSISIYMYLYNFASYKCLAHLIKLFAFAFLVYFMSIKTQNKYVFIVIHDNVMKLEILSALLVLWGSPPVTGGSFMEGQ